MISSRVWGFSLKILLLALSLSSGVCRNPVYLNWRDSPLPELEPRVLFAREETLRCLAASIFWTSPVHRGQIPSLGH